MFGLSTSFPPFPSVGPKLSIETLPLGIHLIADHVECRDVRQELGQLGVGPATAPCSLILHDNETPTRGMQVRQSVVSQVFYKAITLNECGKLNPNSFSEHQ